MDAIVIAGGNPQPQESLYAYSRGNPKALIDIAGKPMVQWVLDALGGAQSVDRVVRDRSHGQVGARVPQAGVLHFK